MNENPTNDLYMNEKGPVAAGEPVERQPSAQPPAAAGAYPYAPNAVAPCPVKKPPFPVARKDYGFAAAFVAQRRRIVRHCFRIGHDFIKGSKIVLRIFTQEQAFSFNHGFHSCH